MQYNIGDKTAPCLTRSLTGNVLIGYCSNEHLLVAVHTLLVKGGCILMVVLSQ